MAGGSRLIRSFNTLGATPSAERRMVVLLDSGSAQLKRSPWRFMGERGPFDRSVFMMDGRLSGPVGVNAPLAGAVVVGDAGTDGPSALAGTVGSAEVGA